jgi:hypothetical protein
MKKVNGFCLVLALGSALAVSALACADSTGPGAASPNGTTVSTTSVGLPGDDDGDGVPNADDQCPDKKEDGLGAKPKDGCPNS